MKNKIITVLLLAGAGFGQDAQAMHRARSFLNKVFCSKTAAVAGVVLGVNGAGFYYLRQNALQFVPHTETTLSQGSQEEVKAFYKSHGHSISIKDSEADQTVRNGDEEFIFLDRRSRDVLDGNSFLGETLERKHILNGLLSHEVDHLKHPDIFERHIEESLIFPKALIAGKMTRVAGGSKKLMAVTGIASWLGLTFAQKKRAQQQEERCDRHAADTIERAENLAFYFKEVGLPYEKKLHSEWTEVFSKLDWSEKNKKQAVISLTDFVWSLQDHPRPSERIAYLNEIAAQLKKKEGQK